MILNPKCGFSNAYKHVSTSKRRKSDCTHVLFSLISSVHSRVNQVSKKQIVIDQQTTICLHFHKNVLGYQDIIFSSESFAIFPLDQLWSRDTSFCFGFIRYFMYLRKLKSSQRGLTLASLASVSRLYFVKAGSQSIFCSVTLSNQTKFKSII